MLISSLVTLFWFVVVLTIIIFIHEMGHLIAARLCGVRVREFSIGFGKELIGYGCPQGTRWKICAIPLGGYVKFFGDKGEWSGKDEEMLSNMSPEDRQYAFHFKPIWKKFLIVFAGPFANYLTAFLIFAFAYAHFGKVVIEPRISEVVAESPAANAGLVPGDLITHFNGKALKSLQELSTELVINQEKPAELTVQKKDGSTQHVAVAPKMEDVTYGTITEKTPRIGIVANNPLYQQFSVLGAMQESFAECYALSAQILTFLKQMVTGERAMTQLSGPITMAKYSGHSASLGFYPVLFLIAFISVNLGLFNLLPIPLVDGGHLCIYAYEMIFRRKLSAGVERILTVIGVSFLFALMAFVVINDIVKMF